MATLLKIHSPSATVPKPISLPGYGLVRLAWSRGGTPTQRILLHLTLAFLLGLLASGS